jgi:hypothetical protein
LSEAKAVEGVIENLIDAVFDDSDLPPMVYCKTASAPDESDCDRFRKLWTEEFPAMIGEINKRGGS